MPFSFLIVKEFGDGSEVVYQEAKGPNDYDQFWHRSLNDSLGYFTLKNKMFDNMLTAMEPHKFIVTGMSNCISLKTLMT